MALLSLVATRGRSLYGIASLTDTKPAPAAKVFAHIQATNPWEKLPNPPWQDIVDSPFMTGTIVATSSQPFVPKKLGFAPREFADLHFITAQDGQRGEVFLGVPDGIPKHSLVVQATDCTFFQTPSGLLIIPTSEQALTPVALPSTSGPYHLGPLGLPVGPQEPDCYDCASFSAPVAPTIAAVSVIIREIPRRPGGTLFLGIHLDRLHLEKVVVETT